jgi:hypothetical protein
MTTPTTHQSDQGHRRRPLQTTIVGRGLRFFLSKEEEEKDILGTPYFTLRGE